jgi:hypothetical protein
VSVYFDLSALAKLVLVEDESDTLRAWIGDRREAPRITNSVGVVELQRLAARVNQAALNAALQMLARPPPVTACPLRVRAPHRPTIATLPAQPSGYPAKAAAVSAVSSLPR